MRQKGFTVIETTLVLIILGIILGISMASYRNYIPRMRLNAAKDEVLATLRLAQTKAIAERKIYQVIFEKATNSYRINPDGESKPLPQGISIANSFDITYQFNPDHTAKMIPCDVTLVNPRNKSVIFYVIPATGYIRVKE
ncbi:MAG: prepilin-type N-terminal cleavage/methylation domain-containing protein [bacterium]|nr:prepilin-type N-terminal cleavage/methylation domain-containing protein [bacterium]